MSGWPQRKFFPLAFKKCINLDLFNLANLIFQWPRSSLISSKTVLLTISPAGSIFSEHLPRSTHPLTTILCHCLSPGLSSPLDADNIGWFEPLADQLCLLWNTGQVIWTSCDSVTFLSNGDKKKNEAYCIVSLQRLRELIYVNCIQWLSYKCHSIQFITQYSICSYAVLNHSATDSNMSSTSQEALRGYMSCLKPTWNTSKRSGFRDSQKSYISEYLL